jgi:nitrate reductase molybdenum cofactor assembly chaperone
MAPQASGSRLQERLTSAFDALAELFEYPREGNAARVRSLAARVTAQIPEAAADVEQLARFAESATLGEAEELYVRTFDANAERALEVGWQVFGEQYERGAFLVDLRGRMRALGVAETTELPDHLTQVLRLLGRMQEDDARTLVLRAVAPSLDRVRKSVEDGNAYGGALAAVAKALEWAAAPAPAAAGGER